MIFFGNIKSELRSDLVDRLNELKLDKSTPIKVLCSGKFTIENLLVRSGYDNVTGNDISFLTALVGNYLAGNEQHFVFKNDFEYLNRYLEKDGSMLNKVSLVLYLYGLAKLYKKKDVLSLNKMRIYFKNADKLIDENKVKFQKQYSELLGKIKFTYTDLLNVVEQSTNDDVLIGSLPILSGDYERIYRILDENIEYEKVPYTNVADNDVYLRTNREILENKRAVCFTDRDLGLDHFLASKYKTNIGGYWYMYSSIFNGKKVFIPKTQTALLDVYDINDCENITRKSKVEVFKCDKYDNVRNKFKSKKLIIIGGYDLSFLVKIDDKYVGGFAFKMGKDFTYFYLLSDFTFINKRKISKLIPMLARSKEIIEFAEIKLNIELNTTLITKVQTKAPMSMKYRGIYQLKNRKDDGLIYESITKERTLREEFLLWFDKYYSKKG